MLPEHLISDILRSPLTGFGPKAWYLIVIDGSAVNLPISRHSIDPLDSRFNQFCTQWCFLFFLSDVVATFVICDIFSSRLMQHAYRISAVVPHNVERVSTSTRIARPGIRSTSQSPARGTVLHNLRGGFSHSYRLERGRGSRGRGAQRPQQDIARAGQGGAGAQQK